MANRNELVQELVLETYLVSESCSRAVFYTVVKENYTKTGSLKSVDVRYTDSYGDYDEYGQYGTNLKPGNARQNDSYLYSNCTITKDGVKITNKHGTTSTAELFDYNKVYTYDAYSD